MLDKLTYEMMKPLVGTSFWAYPETDHKVELRIMDVLKVMESEAARLNRTAFSIFLLGPKSYVMQQAAYPVQHDQLGEPMHMFIVPVSETPDGLLYEAVFT